MAWVQFYTLKYWNFVKKKIFFSLFQRPYRIERLNFTSYSLNEKVELNATINNESELSFDMNSTTNIVRPFAKIEFYLDSGNGLFDMKAVNETIDICRFFREKRYLPVIQLFYKGFSKQGNFPKSCPINKVKVEITCVIQRLVF